MIYTSYESPMGTVYLVEDQGMITHVGLSGNDIPPLEQMEQQTSPVLELAIAQLEEYFAGTRKSFDLPLALAGTDFQKKVWRALQEIPYGETRSYKDIAEFVDSPKGFRAVGGANNKNCHAIVIPCHRVVGVNGDLVGYASGTDNKVFLLELEQYYK